MKTIASLLSLMALSGCGGPEHAEWQQQCVETQTDIMLMPQFMPDGKGGGTTYLMPVPVESCIRSAPVCVAGRDGSRRCTKPDGVAQ